MPFTKGNNTMKKTYYSYYYYALPMIGFGQDDKVGVMLRKKLQQVIEEYYIEEALNEGYKLSHRK